MEVTVGLTTWSEHASLIDNVRKKTTLKEYGQHFPVVEVDTFFYALPQLATVQKWLVDVDPRFQFIVKAHQSMTGHHEVVGGPEAVFEKFKQVIAPLVATGQLKTVLFQFPPYFDARTESIEYLHRVRALMGTMPVAIELRNRSWYQPGVGDALVNYCRDLNLTLVAADEPHQGPGGVPFFLTTTTKNLTMIRLHGRNQAGWQTAGKDWRKKRTLYRYSAEELADLARVIKDQNPAPLETCVIFNNNSGGDAADNALALSKLMGLHFTGVTKKDPTQLKLF